MSYDDSPLVPEVEVKPTCCIVRMPRPQSNIQRQVLRAMALIAFNCPVIHPNTQDVHVFVMPSDPDNTELEALWETINSQFGKFIEVEKVEI